jgi:hypothetical protein
VSGGPARQQQINVQTNIFLETRTVCKKMDSFCWSGHGGKRRRRKDVVGRRPDGSLLSGKRKDSP